MLAVRRTDRVMSYQLATDAVPGGQSSLYIGSLIGRYRDLFGDAEADEVLDEILRRTYERLAAIARSVVARVPGCDAEELLQEAWAERIQKALRPGRPEVNDTEHYFAGAAQSLYHTACDLARRGLAAKRGGEVRRAVLGDEPGPDGSWAAAFWLDFESAAAMLSDEQRAVVERRLVQNLSREETARQLDLREREVRDLLSSAKTLMAVCLADYAEAAGEEI